MPVILKCPHCQKEFIPSTELYQDDYILIDPSQFLVVINGERVSLTPTEHRLLYCLVANADRILSHKQILSSVWGWEYQDDIDYLRIYIWRLRHKLEPEPSQHRYIISENGIGYRFVPYKSSPKT